METLKIILIITLILMCCDLFFCMLWMQLCDIFFEAKTKYLQKTAAALGKAMKDAAKTVKEND